MLSRLRRPACVDTLMAATTLPSPFLIGAASERSPLFQPLVRQRPAATADLAQLLPQPAGAGDGAPGQAG
jgi:hypothetical protein